MKELLRNEKVQKLMLPLAFVLIGIVWAEAMWGDARNVPCYILAALGCLCLILDRRWKPWQRKH